MKILVVGAGVVGSTYAWQLSQDGHQVALYVRSERARQIKTDGIQIHSRDERQKPASVADVVYRPVLTDTLNGEEVYDLIMVCVRAQQLDVLLPLLAKVDAKTQILFFGNNWWGTERIKAFLPAGQYLFGFSRLVGGWRTDNKIDCILFSTPGLETMLGEINGQATARLQNLVDVFSKANLKPAVSQDIVGWLAIHYVEFLGAIGGILKAGSVAAFVEQPETITTAIRATREAFAVCRARGIEVGRAAPLNVRLIELLPIWLVRALMQQQYRTPTIQQFFEENITHGLEELSQQYWDVVLEGRCLDVPMPNLESFGKCYGPTNEIPVQVQAPATVPSISQA